jgi:hypothetical protein
MPFLAILYLARILICLLLSLYQSSELGVATRVSYLALEVDLRRIATVEKLKEALSVDFLLHQFVNLDHEQGGHRVPYECVKLLHAIQKIGREVRLAVVVRDIDISTRLVVRQEASMLLARKISVVEAVSGKYYRKVVVRYDHLLRLPALNTLRDKRILNLRGRGRRPVSLGLVSLGLITLGLVTLGLVTLGRDRAFHG